jgi:hypothetical protein
VAKGSLRKDIEFFAIELSISMETLREKSNRGTQRSPFGSGSGFSAFRSPKFNYNTK